MVVAETIRVRAEGGSIRRGIVREFPTDYRDRLGNRYTVGFEILSVQRGGREEPYREERVGNGVRVFIGDANVFLDPGEYEYLLVYRTTRQLGFFADHDELYWNVNGASTVFPIDSISARVSLPREVPPGSFSIEAYSGPSGSTEQSYDAEIAADGAAMIESTRGLEPGESFTLVATWPKGIVDAPTRSDELVSFLSDNRGPLIASLAFVLTLAYLLFAWHRAGRDPEPGVIFPHYEPPARFSPASVRYVSKMGYDTKAFTAAVINLAVKRHIEIDDVDSVYTLRATPGASTLLAPGEKAVLENMLAHGDSLVLDRKNYKSVLKAMAAHKRSLRRDYNRIYFVTNSALLLPAFGILAIAFLLALVMQTLSLLTIGIFALGALCVFVFVRLMKAPTRLGRKLLDEIEGFRLYLDVAEKDELALRNPPEKTPELFEAYLPYALALGVEQAWAERFVTVFERLQAATGQAYRPVWYRGDWDSARPAASMHALADMTGSLGDAIAASATPPGSSSGAGGGGSAGGGGGGGGVGGW